MSLQIGGIVHTPCEALEALNRLAVRHGRVVNPACRLPGLDVDILQMEAKAVKLCDALLDLLSFAFGVSGKELRSPMRCRREIARVRQIGMYVAHTSFRLSMRVVAIGFNRDRSTVMYACHQIEDLRDTHEFDAIVCAFERLTEQMFVLKRLAA